MRPKKFTLVVATVVIALSCAACRTTPKKPGDTLIPPVTVPGDNKNNTVPNKDMIPGTDTTPERDDTPGTYVPPVTDTIPERDNTPGTDTKPGTNNTSPGTTNTSPGTDNTNSGTMNP